jgi:hypothetical protein
MIVPAGTDCRYLEEDSERDLGRTALAEEVDGAVQVDVVTGGELGRGGGVVAGPLELLGAPRLDPLELAVLSEAGLGRRHLCFLPPQAVSCIFDETDDPVLPIPSEMTI